MSLPPPKGSSQRKRHLFVLGERDIRHRPCSLSLEELSGFDLHPELSSRVFSLSRCLDKRTLCLRCQDVFAKTMENDVALVLIFTGQGFKVEAKKLESWLFWGLKVFHS